jgi:predicted AAA+ superfamily ATPase
MLWQSVSSQLAKENKKFIYGLVREGARARDYETALLWLSDCGLIHRVHRVSKPGIPLRAYEDMKAFKLYMLDVGLLSCMVNLSQDVLLKGNSLFSEFKGALTEQYVLQQLKTIQSMDAYYWTNDSKNNAEVDFVVQLEGEVIPIEVKAEINLHAKSLKVYYEKFKPKFCLRTSMNDFKKESWVINLPLYAISEISMLTKE